MLSANFDGQLYVELKEANVDHVMQEVIQHDAIDRCFFWSFNSEYLDQIRTRYPDAKLMKRRQDFTSLKMLVEAGKPAIIEYDYLIDNLDEFSQCRDQEIKVMLRYPGSDIKSWIKLIKLQPDMVNIDHPFAFTKAYKLWLAQE